MKSKMLGREKALKSKMSEQKGFEIKDVGREKALKSKMLGREEALKPKMPEQKGFEVKDVGREKA